jgi:hypothetical protein
MRELNPMSGSGSAAVTRRIRILRHRTLRWFQPPIKEAVRERPAGDVLRDLRAREN